jgi:hypothetical protein
VEEAKPVAHLVHDRLALVHERVAATRDSHAVDNADVQRQALGQVISGYRYASCTGFVHTPP